MSLPLSTRAVVNGDPSRPILKVLDLREFLGTRLDPNDCALWCDGSPELNQSHALEEVSWGALIVPSGGLKPSSFRSSCVISDMRNSEVLGRGDVIQVNPKSNLVSVLHRRRSRSNSILVTERCNSYCVMCSQPPIDRPDREGHVDRLINIARLIDRDEKVLGVTGGEPTLLGDEFVRFVSQCLDLLPDTDLHVLTNGRTLSNEDYCSRCAAAAGARVVWAVPLYTDTPEIHDFVVQRRGAFVETMAGLMNLARSRQRIEIRLVLQRATVPRLEQFASFIARNLPFVEHVAWMGLEPMGFARLNWNSIWLDPALYAPSLGRASAILELAGIRTSIYNLPLCVLPSALHRFAVRSISDWKNDFSPKCVGCSMQDKCCGFFASAKNEFLPGQVVPFATTPTVNGQVH